LSDHVIIYSVRRNREFVGTGELAQEIGRIGRRQDGGTYQADIILSDEDYPVEQELMSGKGVPVTSCMDEVKNFCFFISPRLSSLDTSEKMINEYKKTLAYSQGKRISVEDVNRYLLENNAVTENEGRLVPTYINSLAVKHYLSVSDISCLINNFISIDDANGWEDDAAIAWGLGNLDVTKVMIYSPSFDGLHNEYLQVLPCLYPVKDTQSHLCAAWWGLLGNGEASGFGHIKTWLRTELWGKLKDILETSIGYKAREHLSLLDKRIMRSIPRQLIPFFKDDSMTKAKASLLFNLGYHDCEDAKDFDFDGYSE